MLPLFIALTLIAIHFAAYVFFVRDLSWAVNEKGIFLYHLALSGVLLVGGSVILALSPYEEIFAGVVGAIALQGIYSVTFLEFWSLAEGGFSLSILRLCAARKGGLSTDPANELGNADFMKLAVIGDDKRKNRLAHLIQSGLVVSEDGRLVLSRKGRIAAGFFKSIRYCATIREHG